MKSNRPAAVEETTWRIGPPMTALAIASVLVLELVLIFGWTSLSTSRDSFQFGLHFGLAGALAVWATSERTQRRLLASMGAILGSAIIGMAHQYCEGTPLSLPESAGFVLLFASFAVFVLASLAVIRFGRFLLFKSGRDSDSMPPLRFGVIQLLGLMGIMAVLASIVHLALPEIDQLLDLMTFVIVGAWAIIPIAAGVLLLDRTPSFWRLGTFAAVGLMAGYIACKLTGWEIVTYAAAVQVAVLAVGIFLPQLDRYTMRITLEPREDAAHSPPPGPSPSEGSGEGETGEQAGAE